MKTLNVKEGMLLVDNHRNGVVVSDNPLSPWHHSTVYSHGSILKDTEGRFIQEVALCETTDADGDLAWSVYWQPDKGEGTFHFVVGTGKWEGITGSGTTLGMVRGRVDDHVMPKFEIEWKIDKENSGKIESLAREGEYTNYATSLSFHGPHVFESTRELANGLSLEVSTQSGVLQGEDPEVESPRSYATCYDRGTTVRRDGKTLGDVMLLEDTDPDGDMVVWKRAWLISIHRWNREMGGHHR